MLLSALLPVLLLAAPAYPPWWVGSCSSGGGTCLFEMYSASGGTSLVQLSPLPSTCTIPGAYMAAIEPIGDHTGDGVAELAVPFCIWTNPAVAVVDVAQKRVIAHAHGADASNRTAALLFTPAGNQGQKYPVLSPGYGEGTDTCVYQPGCGPTSQHCACLPTWLFSCVFTPGALGPSSAANCTGMPAGKAAACDCGGNGFAAVYSAPVVNASQQGLAPYLEQMGIFREVGGYVQDLDGDGTEDVTLIYHWCQVTFSVVTQSLINTVCYDSAQDDPTGHPVSAATAGFGCDCCRL